MLELVRGHNFECSIVRVPRGAYPASNIEELNNELFSKYLELRTKIFTEQKGWQVWLGTKNDLDQYDQFDARYIIAHDRDTGEVLGGARLLRTNRNNGGETEDFRPTYMIRDAYRGVLDGIPPTICASEPPVDEDVWELTRLVSHGGTQIAKAILMASNDFIARRGGKRCLFLGPRAFLKMAKSMGFTPIPLGELSGNKDGRFLAFETNVLPVSAANDDIEDLGMLSASQI